MAIKYLMDVHVHRAVTEGLRRRGIEVLTAQEAAMQVAQDSELLVFALREQWVIFTNDADFLRLHAKGVSHGGIVYCHQQTSISEMIQGLVLIFQAIEPNQMINQLEYI
jgi:predicted nuclease of predicted toxin-antitoxin system